MIVQKVNPKKLEQDQQLLSEQLKELQREQNVKEILSEHQLYHFSYKRFKQTQNIKLITEEAVEAMKAAKQMNVQTKVKVPAVTFLINNLIMFTYQGVQLIIVSFENAKVKLFDATTGHFEQEFFFYDNSTNEDKTQDKNSQDNQNITLSKNYRDVELNYMRRKQLREKGLYKPIIPEFTGLQKYEQISPEKLPQSQIVKQSSKQNQLFIQNHFQQQQEFQSQTIENADNILQETQTIEQNQETIEIQESLINKRHKKNEYSMKIPNYLNCDFWENVESNAPINFQPRPKYQNKTALSKTINVSKQSKSINQNQFNQKSINAKISMFLQEDEEKINQNKNVLSPKIQVKSKNLMKSMKNQRDSSDNSKKQEFNSPRNIILKNAFIQPKQVSQITQKQELQSKNLSINQNLKPKFQEQIEDKKEVSKNIRHSRSKTLVHAKNSKQKNNYTILGIDQLYQRDDHNKINGDIHRMDENHAYGLTDDIFTFTRDKNKKRYQNELWDMVKNDIEKYEELDVNQLRSSLERIRKSRIYEKNSSVHFNHDLSEDNKKGKFKNQNKDKKFLINEILQKKNILDNKIFELKEKQEVFGNWITEFDTQQRIEAIKLDQKAQQVDQDQNQKIKVIVKNKFIQKNNKIQDSGSNIQNNKIIELEQMNQKTVKYMENIEIMNQSLESGIVAPNDKKVKKRNQSSKIEMHQIKDDLQRLRNIRIKQYNDQLQEFNEEEKSKLNRLNKVGRKTYPMCIQYFEPFSIAVFALISREIQIQKLKKTGVRVSFSSLQSLRVENMITEISLDQYSDKNYLILCVATMSKNSKKSEVVVYKLDSRFEFEVVNTWRWAWPQDQITAMLYKQNCGLILAAFSGFMEIFDGKTINQSIWDNQKQLKNKSSHLNSSVPHGSISCLAYSESRDVIAFSGVKGTIYIIDQTIKYQCGYIDAHSNEVVILKFNDKQHQLISIAVNGVVGLWDSQKFTKIQILRPPDQMTQKSITSCDFYVPTGRLMLATSQIFNFDLDVNSEILINNQQQNTVARDYLRQYQYQLVEAGVLDIQQIEADQQAEQIEDDNNFRQQANNLEGSSQITIKTNDSQLKRPSESKSIGEDKQNVKTVKHKKIVLKELTEKQFFQTAFLDNSIKDYLPPNKEFNSSVLPCSYSKLIGCIFDSEDFVIYTIDSDLMIRQWNAATGISQKSYLIETREDQIAQDNNENIDGQQKKTSERKAQFVKSDLKFQYIYISFEGGLIQINCLKTGILIYNNSTVDPILVENEVANFQIFEQSSKFWIAVCCFDGKVAFVTRPQFSQGRNYLKVKKCKGSHQKDVTCLDMFQNQVVTASTDNVICFWNSFSGNEQKMIKIPSDIAKSEKNEIIQRIQFPFKNKKDLLMVILNNGEIYIIETQSEKMLKLNQHFEKNNSGYDLQKQSSKHLSVDQSFQNRHQSDQSQKKLLENSSSQFLNKHQQESQIFKNQYVLGVIEKFPIIYFQDQYLLSCNDSGCGSLNFVKMNIETSNQTNFFKLGNIVPIVLENKGKFSIQIGEFNPIFELQMCLKSRIFLTCQQNGQITIFNLDTIQQLVVLNQEPFNLPLQRPKKKSENQWPTMLTECKKQIKANNDKVNKTSNFQIIANDQNQIKNGINFMSNSRINMLLNEESLLLSPDFTMKTEPDNESSQMTKNKDQSKNKKYGTIQSALQNQSTLAGTQMSVSINKNLLKKDQIANRMQSVQQNYVNTSNMHQK